MQFNRLKAIFCCLLLPSLCGAAIPRGIATVERITLSDRSIAIRVLLAKGVRQTTVQADLPAEGVWMGKQRLKVPVNLRLVRVRGKTVFEVSGKKTGTTVVEIKGPHPSSKLGYGGRFYRGSLRFIATGSAFTVVNKLTLGDYLAGTLGNEMSASWEMEALKAQAVVSRSYALHRLKIPSHRHYDVKSSVADQVYKGANSESPRTVEAVRATNGMYLAYQNRPMKTYFHSRCGGTTAKPEHVWQSREPGQVANIPCAYCRRYPFQWSVKISETELQQILRLPANDRYRFLPVRGPSGRITDVELQGRNGKRRLRSNDFRAQLGYSRLKSTLFEWVQANGQYTFRGTGQGHGVGMCQWGARYLAQTGKKFRQILAHYYPKSALDVL